MNLIKSTGTFSFFTLISRLTGYLRDILIAIFLGAGPIADAFFVAFRLPNTFRRLFSEGTFNAAFVPSYTSELIKGKEKANSFANTIFNLLLLVLFFTILIIEIFMPVVIKIIGAAEATANLLWEFNIAEKKDDKLTKNKNGKVILVRLIAISNFSEFSLNPGAINATKYGIKISIIKIIPSNDNKRILKILFANNSAFFLLLFNSEE